MKYLNIHLPDLHSAKYIGSDPKERASWLSVLGYCCEQENGGRIVGCRAWKDRQWQQTCGVMLKEVESASKLLVWDGQDLTVVFYPIDSERVVQAKRLGGSRGGQLSGQARAKHTSTDTQSTPSTTPSTEGKGKEKEEEEERKRNSAPPPGDTPELPLEQSFPAQIDTEAFRSAWADWMEYRRERRLTPYKPRTVTAQLNTLAEWGEEGAIASIRNGIRQQWQGLFEPRGTSGNAQGGRTMSFA
jgi:hypothetical protein